MLKYKLRRTQIQLLIPDGVLVPRSWFKRLKINEHGIDNLVKSGHLQVVARGIYTKWPSNITWESLVYSLQKNFESDVVAGGLTALNMQGFIQYIPMSGHQHIHLYSSTKLPAWIMDSIPDIGFTFHLNSRLFGRSGNTENEFLKNDYTMSYIWREGMHPMKISVTERALLEVLVDTPKSISIQKLLEFMQGMTVLSPEKIMKLLEACTNVKVKRLFFWLADHFDYAWIKKLDRSKIDLGSGNRKLVDHGKFDKKYKITVPKEL